MLRLINAKAVATIISAVMLDTALVVVVGLLTFAIVFELLEPVAVLLLPLASLLAGKLNVRARRKGGNWSSPSHEPIVPTRMKARENTVSR